MPGKNRYRIDKHGDFRKIRGRCRVIRDVNCRNFLQLPGWRAIATDEIAGKQRFFLLAR